MDWEAIAGLAGGVIAVIALGFSAWQWRDSRESDRLKLLLGEKETVAFEASRIANGDAKVSKDVLDALILAALFEASDRARLQVYWALDELKGGDRKTVVAVRMKYLRAAVKYKPGLDLESFCKRLGQLDSAVPWILDGETENETLVKTICPEIGKRVKA